MSAKDLESTEAIDYIRKVLRTVLLQLTGMAAVSFACSFFTPLRDLIGNIPVLVISSIATIAFFVIMSVKEELRKVAPWNHTCLLAGSISMIVFYGALAGKYKHAAIVSIMMALTLSVAGLYAGALMAKSSTNREYLIRKMIAGAIAGYIVCILLVGFAT